MDADMTPDEALSRLESAYHSRRARLRAGGAVDGAGMTIAATRAQRRQLERDNARQPDTLRSVPRDQWPVNAPYGLVMVRRSRRFLVQIFAEAGCVARMSVVRSTLDGDRWQDGISWDDLQRLKREAGFGDYDAVEVFPRDIDVVNVANMRHLWILSEPLPFGWRAP